TDVHEKEDHYEVDIDLPGFKKDEITLQLKEGYLTVTAAKGLDEEEKDKKGTPVRIERYAGTMQRSFYVGEDITRDEIHAKYEDGVLRLTVPKKEETKKLPENETIMIE
ncbi:MAG: Hsp20/alpha crystallin family protein, partial [Erysipelotrichales bacterium]|nr:Hsp20/alpha crystallin family protein [Erysipelotrichales bacterium]